MLMAFTLVFAIFAYELFSVQWWNADELSQQALTQRLTRTNVPAARGTITDENGAVLARSVGANLTAPVEGHDEVHFH